MEVKRNNSIPWQGILATVMFCDLVLEMADIIIPVRHAILMKVTAIANQVPKAVLIIAGIIIVLFAVTVLFRLIISGTWEVRIFFAYVIWLILTRILNGDHFLQREFLVVMDIVICFLMFASTSQLNELQRDKLLSALVIVYAGFFVFVCIIGLFLTITNTYLCIDPKNDIWIRILNIDHTNNLILFSENKLICASWVYLAWALMIYAFIRNSSVFPRAVLLICSLILFITIPLFHSRTIQIVMAISCGMLALLIFSSILKEWSAALRIPALTIITATAIFIGFFSYNWSNSFITGLRTFYAPRFEAYYSRLESKADPDIFGIDLSSDISADMEEQRKISANSSLTGRTDIWKSGIIAIKRNPSALLYGSISDDLMKPVNRILIEEIDPSVDKDKPHMHNMFFQILMLTGIPGLLLVFVWSGLFVPKNIRFFFLKPECKLISAKYLTIPIAGVFIWHLVEAGLFTKTDIFGKVFFILCGLFSGYYYDNIPVVRETNH